VSEHHGARWRRLLVRPARSNSRMSTFFEFLGAVADFGLTLNLKAAILPPAVISAAPPAPRRSRSEHLVHEIDDTTTECWG
jgi:hypothetical protein